MWHEGQAEHGRTDDATMVMVRPFSSTSSRWSWSSGSRRFSSDIRKELRIIASFVFHGKWRRATRAWRGLRITTDKAKCYPAALRIVLPEVEHRCLRYLNNGVERDHGNLKQRLRPMRGFKQAPSADILARGHALIQNLRNGFSDLTASVPRPLRLMTAWSQLTPML